MRIKITENELIQRKERIAHEAFHLFCQNGIDGVTIKEIAQKADVGEKSIYRYFSTKAELILATCSMLWSEIVSGLIASVEEGFEQENGLGQIQMLLRCFRGLFEDNASYVLFSYDYKLYLIRHSVMLTEIEYIDELRPFHKLFISALQRGMADGSIADHGDPEDIYYAIWGLMRGYVVKIVIYDNMYEGKDIWRGRFDLACELILGGLKNQAS